MVNATRFTNLEVTGAAEIAGALKAASVDAPVTGAAGGPITSSVQISKGANYELADAEKLFYIGVTLTAASKTVTLGLADGQVAVVYNEGDTNTFTLKNVAGDTGTSLAKGKAVLVVGNSTADTSIVIALN